MAAKWLVINERNEVVVDEGWEWCRFASSDLLNFRADGREGLYDWRSHRVVIKPSFKSITGPTDSVLVVQDVDSEYCRLIDFNGRRVGQETFWHVREFVDGFAAASREEGAFGFINLAGEWVIPPKFYNVNDFSEGLSAVFSHTGEHFYVDRNGDPVIEGPFIDAHPFSEGLARVRNENGDHFIDKTGNVILSGGQEWFHGGMFKCGRARVLSQRHQHKSYFIDKTGRMVGETLYEDSRGFSENVAAVSQNKKWGLVDLDGRLIVPYSFDRVDKHHCGLSATALNGKYGYIDSTGHWVIQPQYSLAVSFHSVNRLACVKVD